MKRMSVENSVERKTTCTKSKCFKVILNAEATVDQRKTVIDAYMSGLNRDFKFCCNRYFPELAVYGKMFNEFSLLH